MHSRGRAIRHLLAVSVLAAMMATGIGPLAHPASVAASTADDMEAQLLGLINSARVEHGLVPFRSDPTLIKLAGDRAAHMAATGVMAHPSCLRCVFDSYKVQYYAAGENIAWSGWPWGSQAASTIFTAWKNSPVHWAQILSTKFNYIGVGVAYRSSGHKTFASTDFSESKDHTRPWARMAGSSRAGTTVKWSWTGADTRLQTHASGLKSFDVQYRVGSGTWKTIRSGTTAKSLSLSGRAHGHHYGLRVRARDNLGYVSGWSAEKRIWVP
jgi:uncharacterized protein YkwD